MSKTKTVTIELPQATRMMTRVEVDPEHRQLYVRFADGRTAAVPVTEIERAGKPVTLDLSRVELPDPYVILIANTEGGVEEIPWDLVRHYCDAEFSRSEQEKDELSRQALGERIRRLRKRAGLTQAELAKRARIGRITVVRIENGQMYARVETLRRIAQALDVKLVDLIAPHGALKTL
jgi:DNA-binding XRE family transcriptional regulator